MNLGRIASTLQDGDQVTFVARGHSMAPKIKDGDRVSLRPVNGSTIQEGDIVLAKVNGTLYLHLVSAIENDHIQISNNRGRVNGWCMRRNIIGVRV